MDIIVSGNGKKSYKPNKVKIDFTFIVKEKTYDKALDEGLKNVNEYLSVLKKAGFENNEMKTANLRIYENSVYDSKSQKHIKDGWIYKQGATLKFDYDMKKLAKIIDETSKINNPPTYRAYFNVEDDKINDEVTKLAVEDAKRQAECIANASNMKLKSCAKVSFQPIDEPLTSKTEFDGQVMYKACANRYETASQRDNIENIFIPEDIEVFKEIFALWIAE